MGVLKNVQSIKPEKFLGHSRKRILSNPLSSPLCTHIHMCEHTHTNMPSTASPLVCSVEGTQELVAFLPNYIILLIPQTRLIKRKKTPALLKHYWEISIITIPYHFIFLINPMVSSFTCLEIMYQQMVLYL